MVPQYWYVNHNKTSDQNTHRTKTGQRTNNECFTARRADVAGCRTLPIAARMKLLLASSHSGITNSSKKSCKEIGLQCKHKYSKYLVALTLTLATVQSAVMSTESTHLWADGASAAGILCRDLLWSPKYRYVLNELGDPVWMEGAVRSQHHHHHQPQSPQLPLHAVAQHMDYVSVERTHGLKSEISQSCMMHVKITRLLQFHAHDWRYTLIWAWVLVDFLFIFFICLSLFGLVCIFLCVMA